MTLSAPLGVVKYAQKVDNMSAHAWGGPWCNIIAQGPYGSQDMTHTKGQGNVPIMAIPPFGAQEYTPLLSHFLL